MVLMTMIEGLERKNMLVDSWKKHHILYQHGCVTLLPKSTLRPGQRCPPINLQSGLRTSRV